MRGPARLCGTLLAALLSSGCSNSLVDDGGLAGAQPVSQEVDRVVELNTQLGVGYLREGRLDLAYMRLSRALEMAPDYAAALNAMALLYDRRGETDKAEQHYQAALRSNPADPAALNNYGGFLCRRGHVDAALERFEAALNNPLYDTPEAALSNAGLCLMNVSERRDEAERYLRRALERAPRLSGALIAMSELSLDKGSALAARGYLQRYLEDTRHNARSLWLGIRIERALGDRDAVSSYGMLLKANFPDATETMLLLESERQ